METTATMVLPPVDTEDVRGMKLRISFEPLSKVTSGSQSVTFAASGVVQEISLDGLTSQVFVDVPLAGSRNTVVTVLSVDSQRGRTEAAQPVGIRVIGFEVMTDAP